MMPWETWPLWGKLGYISVLLILFMWLVYEVMGGK